MQNKMTEQPRFSRHYDTRSGNRGWLILQMLSTTCGHPVARLSTLTTTKQTDRQHWRWLLRDAHERCVPAAAADWQRHHTAEEMLGRNERATEAMQCRSLAVNYEEALHNNGMSSLNQSRPFECAADILVIFDLK